MEARPWTPRRVIFFVLGFLFLGIGIVGIVLPLIPTTGPLLLATAFFANSSRKFHDWLVNHRVFGTYIRNYRDRKGMTARHKRYTLATLWVGIGLSAFVVRHSLVALIALAAVVLGVTIHILTLKTAPPEAEATPG